MDQHFQYKSPYVPLVKTALSIATLEAIAIIGFIAAAILQNLNHCI